MSIIHRPKALAAVALALLTGSGCVFHRSEFGWCVGPMFRLERNRPGMQSHGRDCNCAHEGMEVAKPVEYDGAPITVETQPLQMLGGEIVNGTIIGGNAAMQAYPAPAGPSANGVTRVFQDAGAQQQSSPPAQAAQQPANNNNAGGGQGGVQQAKKARPGSLSVSLGSRYEGAILVSPGQTTDLFILVQNTGDLPIADTSAEVLLSNNLKAESIKRTEGSGLKGAFVDAVTTAVIERDKVLLDRLTNLGPERMIEYVLKVRALPGSSGPATVKVRATSSALEQGKPLEKTLPLVIQ